MAAAVLCVPGLHLLSAARTCPAQPSSSSPAPPASPSHAAQPFSAQSHATSAPTTTQPAAAAFAAPVAPVGTAAFSATSRCPGVEPIGRQSWGQHTREPLQRCHPRTTDCERIWEQTATSAVGWAHSVYQHEHWAHERRPGQQRHGVPASRVRRLRMRLLHCRRQYLPMDRLADHGCGEWQLLSCLVVLGL